jgi:thiol-disulfide isomerase/thioredoxin
VIRVKILCVGGLLMLGALGCGAGEPEAERPLASDFTLPLLGGDELTLSKFRGRPVLIDFWATWCAPCVGQVPLFNEFHERYGADIPLLAVATDTDGAEAVAPFAEEHGIEYPVLLGSEALARDWGLLGFPTLFVIDAEGRIQEAHVGPLTEEWLMELVDDLAADG